MGGMGLIGVGGVMSGGVLRGGALSDALGGGGMMIKTRTKFAHIFTPNPTTTANMIIDITITIIITFNNGGHSS